MTARAVIVGTGLMGRWHARYAVRAGARVTALIDQDPGATRALTRAFPKARSFPTLAACLEVDDVDVVHVCTPSETHVSLALAALHAGKHVIVEKPAAVTERQAQQLIEAAGLAGRLICPAHQAPFQRGFSRLRSERPTLGSLQRATYVVNSAAGVGLGPSERRTLLIEILPHAFSVVRALLDQHVPATVFELLDFDSDSLTLTGCHGGVRLDLALSLSARPRRHELVAYFTRATARADLFHGYALLERAEDTRLGKLTAPFSAAVGLLFQAGGNLLGRAWRREPAYPGLPELLRAFYAAVATGGASPVPVAELLETALLLERVARAG